eukprot:5713111-Amphidinium_carterae.1
MVEVFDGVVPSVTDPKVALDLLAVFAGCLRPLRKRAPVHAQPGVKSSSIGQTFLNNDTAERYAANLTTSCCTT